jgi:hypothetical protein
MHLHVPSHHRISRVKSSQLRLACFTGSLLLFTAYNLFTRFYRLDIHPSSFLFRFVVIEVGSLGTFTYTAILHGTHAHDFRVNGSGYAIVHLAVQLWKHVTCEKVGGRAVNLYLGSNGCGERT